MSHSTKRTFSTIAIVIASVSFGILISADLGLMPTSNAQTTSSIQTSQGPVTSVSIPSFADVAARVAPAVVSITTTEIIKPSAQRRQFGGVDPFDFFFPDPRDPHRQRRNDDEDERPQRGSGSASSFRLTGTFSPTTTSSKVPRASMSTSGKTRMATEAAR